MTNSTDIKATLFSPNFKVTTSYEEGGISFITVMILSGSPASKEFKFNTFLVKRYLSNGEVNICNTDLIDYVQEIRELIASSLLVRLGSRESTQPSPQAERAPIQILTEDAKQLVDQARERCNTSFFKGEKEQAKDRELLNAYQVLEGILNPQPVCTHPTSFEDRCCSCGVWVN